MIRPIASAMKRSTNSGSVIVSPGLPGLNGSIVKLVGARLATARAIRMTASGIRTTTVMKRLSMCISWRRRPSSYSSSSVAFSRSRSSLPVLKNGTHFSSTSTDSPVRGLRPTRAGRFFTENAPNPRSSTRLPLASASVISSKIALTMFSTSRRNRCGLRLAMVCTSSDLIIVGSSRQMPWSNYPSDFTCLLVAQPRGRLPDGQQPVKEHAVGAGACGKIGSQLIEAEQCAQGPGQRKRREQALALGRLPLDHGELRIDALAGKPLDRLFLSAERIDQPALQRLPAGEDRTVRDLQHFCARHAATLADEADEPFIAVHHQRADHRTLFFRGRAER